jgi:glucosamine--fructose-6-phosphate aminotransferase (isomerizing)
MCHDSSHTLQKAWQNLTLMKRRMIRMCGIVGYVGPRNAVDVVMEGLKRLEYRGYDSSGLCLQDSHGDLVIRKAVGKIDHLARIVDQENLQSHISIGHTRWATHGKVIQENAHPHGNSDLAIVHNGIIENSDELKEMLIREGHRFLSETDTEVFFALLVRYLNQLKDLSLAISQAFQHIHGNSAFVILEKGSGKIFTIKRSAPIVCGTRQGHHEAFVSSDPYALVGYADTLYFPENEVLCVLSPYEGQSVKFYELDGTPSQRYRLKAQNAHLQINEKGDFEHYMLKEIHEQPQLIRQFTHYYLEGQGVEELRKIQNQRFHRVHIVACGTAWHAGLVIKEYFEKILQCPTNVELASEFRYRSPLIDKNDLCLCISQSGETADTLAAQELCQQQGITTYSIVNVEGSTLYRQSDLNFLIHAGMEIGVASTKAFTLQVLTGLVMVKAMENAWNGENKDTLKYELQLLAHRCEELLQQKEASIAQVARELYGKKGFIFTARGKFVPVALEGALKLKEIAYVHAEGYAAGELKHGPIALIDSEMVNVAILGPELFDKAYSNVQEVKARSGIIVGITPFEMKYLDQICDYNIPLLFQGLTYTSVLYTNIVTQLLAYYIAKYRGTDIDRPRNLAKSVTVE